MQRIRVLLLTATSPLLESVTSCCLMLWPNMPSGSSWRRENQSSMEAMGSVLFGCCFCCFLTISWGSQHLSVTCVSLTFVPISTYYHQTSVIYFYGFVHEMKLNWAVVSLIHYWTWPFSVLSLQQKELVWMLSGPCILLLLMKGLVSLVSWPRCIVLPLDLFFFLIIAVTSFLEVSEDTFCRWVNQHGWTLAV